MSAANHDPGKSVRVAAKNFKLRLSPDLHAGLRAASKLAGVTKAEVARVAIQSWLGREQRRRVQEELRAFVETYAGTEWDFDPMFSAAGAECFLNAYPDDDWSGEPSYPDSKFRSTQQDAHRI